MSKQTAATSIEITAPEPTLMLAFELGETGWLLGFFAGYCERVLRRRITSRDTAALDLEIEQAKQQLGLPLDAPGPGVPRHRERRRRFGQHRGEPPQ